MIDLLTYLRIEHRAAIARASFLEQQIADLEAIAAQAGDLPVTFNPAWKHGARLTTLGRRALEAAFEEGMEQAEAARLFRISLTRAHVLHREWRLAAGAPETLPEAAE